MTFIFDHALIFGVVGTLLLIAAIFLLAALALNERRRGQIPMGLIFPPGWGKPWVGQSETAELKNINHGPGNVRVTGDCAQLRDGGNPIKNPVPTQSSATGQPQDASSGHSHIPAPSH
jgi:hypothetical protein